MTARPLAYRGSAYAGATTRTQLADALDLSSSWAYQPKIDGCYAQISTDAAGRIWSVVSRTGAELAEGRDLHGIVAGPPLSVLVAELEAHTEAGIRAAATRGYRLAHLFDCLRLDGRDLSGEPYADRRGAICRAQSWVESEGLARDRSLQVDARGDAHDRAGRYTPAIPRDLRRLPVVPQVRGRAAALELWRSYVGAGGEGLVAVNLDAPAGKRGCKRKVKATDTLDVLVTAREGRCVRVAWRGSEWVIQCARPYPVGAVVEVAHDGWYASGEPRFPRAVRQRLDLTAADVTGAVTESGHA